MSGTRAPSDAQNRFYVYDRSQEGQRRNQVWGIELTPLQAAFIHPVPGRRPGCG